VAATEVRYADGKTDMKRMVTKRSWNAELPIRKAYNGSSTYRRSWKVRENERGTSR
jgi:NADH:ubiquinone oxidoreductase subunit C